MFGFSFGELLLIVLVALMVLGPQELLEIIKSSRKVISQVHDWYNSYLEYFKRELKSIESESEDQEVVNYILDLDGNIQKTYDLSKIMPDLKQTKDE